MTMNRHHRFSPASRWHCLPGWLELFLLVGLASSLIAHAASLPVAKVIQRYALTSANDFPQRDPQDWRLLASNDGGKTWVTLDVRKGESFQERHQRRTFVFTNDV